MTRDEAKAVNAAAKREALADPVRTAADLAASRWLADRLALWPDPWEADPMPPGDDPAWKASAAAVHLAQVRIAERIDTRNPEAFRQQAAGWAIEALAALPEAPDATRFLTLLAAWWPRRPREAQAVEGGPAQGSLFPAPAVHRPPDRGGRPQAWKRFSLPVKRRSQLVLPGLSEARRGIVTPDIPLDWWEALGEVSSKSGTLTMATRLFGATLMGADLADRHGNRFIRRTVAEWFEWLHPDPAKANRSRLWRDLRSAIDVIRDLPRVTFRYPDGGMEAVRLVSVHGVPPRNDPTDRLSMQISFPPDAERFSVAVPWTPVLRWGVSRRRSRAAALLFRLAFRWSEPNHGRVKVGKGKRQRWTADARPDRYRPIGEAEAAALVSPQGGSHRTPARAAADLAGLAGSGDVVLFGADGKPIAFRGTDRRGTPVPSPATVRDVREAMRAGALKALPPGTP